MRNPVGIAGEPVRVELSALHSSRATTGDCGLCTLKDTVFSGAYERVEARNIQGNQRPLVTCITVLKNFC
ncbi:unnamed protein product [Amoebophrya sp. A25]|nr:unnamed protein product [Amoebophrya sp. A25]|eukprot:GSA25T00009127001.1